MYVEKEDRLYQTEEEWLATGQFSVAVNEMSKYEICTVSSFLPEGQTDEGHTVIFVGGIPRDPERQNKLPVINKMHGLLAVKLAQHGVRSLLFNQPGTGRSTGDLSKDTMKDRIDVLAELTQHVAHRNKASHISFIGMSAGSYLAARATDQLKDSNLTVTALILQSPALYNNQAEHEPYGPSFAKTLNNSWDYHSSPVFHSLNRYVSGGGRVHITYFQRDNPPIPEAIQHAYLEWTAVQDKLDVSIASIAGVEHNFRRLNRGANRNVVDNSVIRKVVAELVTIIT